PNNPLFPDGGYVGLTDDPVEWAHHLILPWFCLSILFIGFYGRVLRSNMLDVMNEDYVRTARAKGLAPKRVLLKHVLRNSMIPIVTLFALDFAAVLGGGAILTETVFDLKGVGFELERGKVLGIVGESGSGKSVTAMTLLGLTRDQNAGFEGEVLYKGQNVLTMPESRLRDIRGNEIAMIFQDPMTSLNPVYRVGQQIVEAIRAHESVSKRQARRRTIDLLKQVGIPSAEERVDAFPHELSGGMRQRAMIALALSCNPDIVIADEPTTALDVTIQAQILALLDKLRAEFDSAVIATTHDLR